MKLGGFFCFENYKNYKNCVKIHSLHNFSRRIHALAFLYQFYKREKYHESMRNEASMFISLTHNAPVYSMQAIKLAVT